MSEGKAHWRDLPWRATYDPYEIWISEVMLQQTQVARVLGRWERWLVRFPTLEALADAQTADVLEEWQGMGYNRRALSLHKAAAQLVTYGGFPQEVQDLVALPGIGNATAAGIRAFAFNLPAVYLETNVRTVFLHELFPTAEQVPDSVLVPLVQETCPKDASQPEDCPRTWYYALLDYGAYLKQVVPNPSRRSKTYAKQSRFEGSRRQKRAALVRIMLDAREAALLTSEKNVPARSGVDAPLAARIQPSAKISTQLSFQELYEALNKLERAVGRPELSSQEVLELLDELTEEGFCTHEDDGWRI